MGGVRPGTPLATMLDVLQVTIMDVPVDELKKWRKNLNRSLWKIRPPARETWGRLPGQEEETKRLISRSS